MATDAADPRVLALVEKLRANGGYALVQGRRSATAIVRADADLLVSAGLADYQPGEMTTRTVRYHFGRICRVKTCYTPGICILR